MALFHLSRIGNTIQKEAEGRLKHKTAFSCLNDLRLMARIRIKALC